jgi:hypothetical protein
MLKTSSGQTALGGLEKKLTGNVPDDSDVPDPVRKSVRLMLCGGAVTVAMGAFVVIATIADKNAFTDSSGKRLTTGEFASGIISYVLFYLLMAAVWVLMARLNRAGRGWARYAASVLAVISTLEAWSVVSGLRGGQTITVLEIVAMVGTLALWLIGAAAAILLWRPESSAYFKARTAAR